ncbi:ATP-dependent DNA helicase [Aphis craccivora]|uniref:ATP-dependent DNA helicase n=1 Tax=Aphis craccivora TaxID=307492 RepID=A0A6G0VNQ6_APHCR|nr:ATP-dependent DNA helicase [Aphis craccivora]
MPIAHCGEGLWLLIDSFSNFKNKGIPMITNEYPFEFKRVQFPVKLCFAMSINKAQGQTMKAAGIDISDPCFTHGQFYVACSRVNSEKNLYIYAPGEITNNIVYKEILVNR